MKTSQIPKTNQHKMCEFCAFRPGYACHGTKLCYEMALWEETLMKERMAKVCKLTPKFPYNQFTIVDSILAACLERVHGI